MKPSCSIPTTLPDHCSILSWAGTQHAHAHRSPAPTAPAKSCRLSQSLRPQLPHLGNRMEEVPGTPDSGHTPTWSPEQGGGLCLALFLRPMEGGVLDVPQGVARAVLGLAVPTPRALVGSRAGGSSGDTQGRMESQGDWCQSPPPRAFPQNPPLAL